MDMRISVRSTATVKFGKHRMSVLTLIVVATNCIVEVLPYMRCTTAATCPIFNVPNTYATGPRKTTRKTASIVAPVCNLSSSLLAPAAPQTRNASAIADAKWIIHSEVSDDASMWVRQEMDAKALAVAKRKQFSVCDVCSFQLVVNAVLTCAVCIPNIAPLRSRTSLAWLAWLPLPEAQPIIVP